jgi:hypothetical protein
VPVIATPGDFDGDGKTDCALYDPATESWYIVSSATGVGTWTAYGVSDAEPVPADYDGDGKMDLAVYSPSVRALWIFRSTDGGETYIDVSAMTVPGSVPVLRWPQ